MEGILLNVKNTDGGASTATLVTQALRSKKIFVFGELLALPQVQKLRESQQTAPVLQALEIFAYGTYMDYANTPNLPELNETQVSKLRQLTVVSLASLSKSLDYSQIIRECGLQGNPVREAEDLVIACVYDRLLRARLDQRNRKVLVQFSASRDVRPVKKIDEMLAKLTQWCDSADGILRGIDQAVEFAGKQRQLELEEHKVVADEAEHMKAQVMKESSESTLGKMDDGGLGRQGSKRGGGGVGGGFGSMASNLLGRRG
jgi:COP9 signalosome complex subunit 7